MTEKSESNNKPWLLRVLQGALIGVSAILPGISGGALCVIFGIYQPMMQLLGHPLKTFKTHAKLLLPVVIGGAAGFLGLARVVEWMFRSSFNLAVWFFIGLIAGMLPSLFREAGKKGRSKGSWTAFAISAVLCFALLLLIQGEADFIIEPGIFWFFVCGILWGFGLIVPGMSPSSLLIFLGLYQPMAQGIAELSPGTIIPLAAGLLLVVAIAARAVNMMFDKHYSVSFHLILGFVIASTLAIIPVESVNLTTAVKYAGCFIIGLLLSSLMDKLNKKRCK